MLPRPVHHCSGRWFDRCHHSHHCRFVFRPRTDRSPATDAFSFRAEIPPRQIGFCAMRQRRNFLNHVFALEGGFGRLQNRIYLFCFVFNAGILMEFTVVVNWMRG